MADLQPILDHVPQALLVIFRIGGLMIFAPVFGSSIIPGRIKIFLSVVIGLAACPLLSATDHNGVQLRLEAWSLAPAIALELMIGLIIGFVANLPLQALSGGGLIMGQQMGLGFGQLYNPAIDDEVD